MVSLHSLIGWATEGLSSGIVFLSQSRINLAEKILRECSQELPSKIKRLEDRSVLIAPLRDEFTLKFLNEFYELMILSGKSFFTHDSLHGHHVLASSIRGVQLIRHSTVVLAGQAFTDSTLHQS